MFQSLILLFFLPSHLPIVDKYWSLDLSLSQQIHYSCSISPHQPSEHFLLSHHIHPTTQIFFTSNLTQTLPVLFSMKSHTYLYMCEYSAYITYDYTDREMNDRLIGEYRFEMNVERTICGMIWGTVQTFDWNAWTETPKPHSWTSASPWGRWCGPEASEIQSRSATRRTSSIGLLVCMFRFATSTFEN
jgi:hypothetical protein